MKHTFVLPILLTIFSHNTPATAASKCQWVFEQRPARLWFSLTALHPMVKFVLDQTKEQQDSPARNQLLETFTREFNEELTAREMLKLANATTTRFHRSAIVSMYISQRIPQMSVQELQKLIPKMKDDYAGKRRLISDYLDHHLLELPEVTKERLTNYILKQPRPWNRPLN